MKKRITAVILILALACACVLPGCVTADPAPENAGGKAITVAVSSDTGSMDPAGSIALTYLAYSVSALDELLTFDEDGEIDYRAAESYEVNEDSTEWTFHLREDAQWSDGTPVTAADFLNTITRALDPASGSGYAFHLAEPCVYFLDLLRLPVYTPSCAKYADSAESGWDRDPGTSLANGPFRLEKYVPDQYFILEKNEYYWNADAVNLDRITYRFFDDTQAMANAYEAGEVDVATSLSSTVMEMYEGQDDLFVTDLIATRYIYMNLNVEPLDDVRVREAVNLAINRDDLCTIVGSDTEPAYNLVAKYMKDRNTGGYFVDEAEQPFEENVERARELLAGAGYPDGEGFPELTYKYPTLEMDSVTAQVVQEQLKNNLGITIRLEAQELQANYSSRHAGDFDLCRMNWTADFADPYTYLSMLMSNSTYNCSGIHDPQYDELVAQSGSESDPAARAELMHRAEQLAVGEQFYIIPLYAMKSVNLVNPQVTGIRQIPASGSLEYRYADIG